MMVQAPRGWLPSAATERWFGIAVGATLVWLLIVFFLSGELDHRWFWIIGGVLLLAVAGTWVSYGLVLRRDRIHR